jgi:hypothetical protein
MDHNQVLLIDYSTPYTILGEPRGMLQGGEGEVVRRRVRRVRGERRSGEDR